MVQQWFNAVDQDKSGQISFLELQKALVNGDGTYFNDEACKYLIKMFDTDKSTTLNVHEFGALFRFVHESKALFETFDKNKNGFLEQDEFTQALTDMGYSLSPTSVQVLPFIKLQQPRYVG